MDEAVLLGRGGEITRYPAADWKRELAEAPARISRRLDFMSPDHHAVRAFVVTELARTGRPVTPDTICDVLRLPAARTGKILDDLEARLFFLVRDGAGAVAWAFPVTAAQTPHRLVFDTGERLHAA